MKRKFVQNVKSKVVDQIVWTSNAEGNTLEIRFADKTGLAISFEVALKIESAELRDWKKGEGTLVRKFL